MYTLNLNYCHKTECNVWYLLAKHNQCSTCIPRIFTFPKNVIKRLRLDVLKADGVALMHCCSAFIVTLSKEYAWLHTDRLNTRSRVDKEHKSYAISKLNIEHLLLVKWNTASQKRLKMINVHCPCSSSRWQKYPVPFGHIRAWKRFIHNRVHKKHSPFKWSLLGTSIKG